MTDYYVDPAGGSDGNSGTSVDSAFATFDPIDPYDGSESLSGGDTVYVRGTDVLSVGELDLRSYGGSSSSPITVTNYEDEQPVIDFASGNGSGARLEATEYLVFENLELKNSAEHGIRANRAISLKIRNCSVHGHGAGGSYGGAIQIREPESDGIEIRNCELYDGLSGGNSDGIIAGEGVSGLRVLDCNIHHNSDDGIDVKGKNSPIDPAEFRRTICWENGHDLDNTISGNGNGFKFGDPDLDTGGHTVVNCVAFNNDHRGFGDPGINIGMTFHNCTSVGNGSANFWLTDDNADHDIANCISQNSENWDCKIDSSNATVRACNWDESQRGDFNATDGNGVEISFRSADAGSSDFLRLAAGSPAIDAGVDVGLPYEGNAPDWGRYEYASSTTDSSTDDSTTDTSSSAVMKIYTGSEWIQVS